MQEVSGMSIHRSGGAVLVQAVEEHVRCDVQAVEEADQRAESDLALASLDQGLTRETV